MVTSHSDSPVGRGFTIIEAVVCIGIAMMLLGLSLPYFAGVRDSAQKANDLSTIRSNFSAIMLYCDDHRGVFPVASDSVARSMDDWNTPLVTLEYVAELWQTDPEGIRKHGLLRFAMSGALFHPPAQMTPEHTVPLDYARTIAVRSFQVIYPSEKGVLVQSIHVEPGQHIFWTWNPDARPISPVAMADGSATTARCTDFTLKHGFQENWVGHPVLSTWDGFHGIDRRH